MSLQQNKSLVREIQDEISRIQEKLTGDRDYAHEWLALQKLWSKLANINVIESELVAAVNKKILDLIQEKESLEEVMNLTNVKPNQHYADVCSNLKLLEELNKL